MADRSGNVWTAYVPVKGGYRRLNYTEDGNLFQFRPDWAAAGKFPGLAPRGGLLVVFPGKGGAGLAHYEIHRGVAHCHDLRTFDYRRPKDIKLLSAILKRDIERQVSNDYFAHLPLRELSAAAIRAKGLPDSPLEKKP